MAKEMASCGGERESGDRGIEAVLCSAAQPSLSQFSLSALLTGSIHIHGLSADRSGDMLLASITPTDRSVEW